MDASRRRHWKVVSEGLATVAVADLLRVADGTQMPIRWRSAARLQFPHVEPQIKQPSRSTYLRKTHSARRRVNVFRMQTLNPGQIFFIPSCPLSLSFSISLVQFWQTEMSSIGVHSRQTDRKNSLMKQKSALAMVFFLLLMVSVCLLLFSTGERE